MQEIKGLAQSCKLIPEEPGGSTRVSGLLIPPFPHRALWRLEMRVHVCAWRMCFSGLRISLLI